jgi:predicted TIM-barrel fold metal-dependent hydrolase
MQTPWGEVPVRDAHAHLFTRRFFETMAGLAPLGRLAGSDLVSSLAQETSLEIPRERGGAVKQWELEIVKCGIASTVLMGSIPGESDEVADAVNFLGGSCIGYAMVDPTKPNCGAIITQMKEKGLRGAAFFPAMHGYRISDEAIRPALDSVRDSGLVAFVHFGLLRLGLRDLLGIGSPFDLRYANPIDLHGVALRYPEITFQIPHFGCGFFREVLLLVPKSPM